MFGNRQKKHYLRTLACAALCGFAAVACGVSSRAEEADSTGGAYTAAEIEEKCSSSVVKVYQEEKSGSGVIVARSDERILIVTNDHVIENTTEISVYFEDSGDVSYTAQIARRYPDSDLAVLSVALSDLSEEMLDSVSVADFGNSNLLEVGEEVVAIGYPDGQYSVSFGVVISSDCSLTELSLGNAEEDIYNTGTFIETDAEIQPGSSGGGLFNRNGELIGIPSVVASDEIAEEETLKEYAGMGFAIPAATVQSAIGGLLAQGIDTADHGSLNAYVGTVSYKMMHAYCMPKGALVDSVIENGAAEKAGLVARDVITSMNGKAISSFEELVKELQSHASGETVEMTIQRININGGSGYEEQTLTVTLD